RKQIAQAEQKARARYNQAEGKSDLYAYENAPQPELARLAARMPQENHRLRGSPVPCRQQPEEKGRQSAGSRTKQQDSGVHGKREAHRIGFFRQQSRERRTRDQG